MKQNKNIYEKVTQLNSIVKEQLRKKGFVVPIQLDDGSIKLGSYVVKKNSNGFFEIKNQTDKNIVDQINLPQTALIVANKLALGKWLDTDILILDKQYGYAAFDEEVHLKAKTNSLKSKNFSRLDIMTNKIHKAKHKKEYLRKVIFDNFQKLIHIR